MSGTVGELGSVEAVSREWILCGTLYAHCVYHVTFPCVEQCVRQ